MPAPTQLEARRWAVVLAAWLLGAGTALVLHASEAPKPASPQSAGARAELERTRREQALLRAESTVRLLRTLESHPDRAEVGP